MQIYFVAALVFAVLVAILAIQNSTPVNIQFFWWEIEQISQVLVILGSAAVGALAVLFTGLGKQVRLLWQVRQLTQQNARLKEENEELKRKISPPSDTDTKDRPGENEPEEQAGIADDN